MRGQSTYNLQLFQIRVFQESVRWYVGDVVVGEVSDESVMKSRQLAAMDEHKRGIYQ